MKKPSFKRLKALKSLLGKSVQIQLHIEDESRKVHPDWFRIITLKKQRLMIKDRISKLRKKRSTEA
jgi:uncharacterized protein YdcH (DUF465 family)